jgi:hypothetical protein
VVVLDEDLAGLGAGTAAGAAAVDAPIARPVDPSLTKLRKAAETLAAITGALETVSNEALRSHLVARHGAKLEEAGGQITEALKRLS